MHLGAMNGLPGKPASDIRTRTTILLRRCLSSALSALNTFFYNVPRARGLTLGFNLASASRLDRPFADTPFRPFADTPLTSHLAIARNLPTVVQFYKQQCPLTLRTWCHRAWGRIIN